MSKILNLDKLAPPKRKLSLFGKTYEVREQTVDDFIKNVREAEDEEKAEKDAGQVKSVSERMEASIKTIVGLVIGIEESLVRSLSMEQLAVLAKFVRGEEISEDEGAEQGND